MGWDSGVDGMTIGINQGSIRSHKCEYPIMPNDDDIKRAATFTCNKCGGFSILKLTGEESWAWVRLPARVDKELEAKWKEKEAERYLWIWGVEIEREKELNEGRRIDD